VDQLFFAHRPDCVLEGYARLLTPEEQTTFDIPSASAGCGAQCEFRCPIRGLRVPYDDELEQLLLLRETLSDDGNLLSGLQGTRAAYQIPAPFTNTFDDAGCNVAGKEEKEVCAVAHCLKRLEILRRFPCAKSFVTGEVVAGSVSAFSLTSVGIMLIFALVAATVPCAVNSLFFGRTSVGLAGDKEVSVRTTLSRSIAGALARIAENDDDETEPDNADNEDSKRKKKRRATEPALPTRTSVRRPSKQALDDDASSEAAVSLPGAAWSESDDTYRRSSTDLESAQPGFQRPTMKASDAYKITTDAKFGRSTLCRAESSQQRRRRRSRRAKARQIR
jgi:hypothetical protein